MKDNVTVAVVGATGLVGKTMLEILAERDFPVTEVHALASARSVGKTVPYGDRRLDVMDLAGFDFSQADLALFSAGASVSGVHATRAAEAGCVVIDNTSRFRYDDDVPLVVPEVNAGAIAQYGLRNIIANPNCSTIQMLVALKPIYDAVGIARINVATYQAVSGAGAAAVERLAKDAAARLGGQPIEEADSSIAFNAVPQIDVMTDNGYTREEMKMLWETRKILDDDDIGVNATAVRVPVFFGHSEAIHIETREHLPAPQARELLESAPGVELTADENGATAATAVGHAAGNDPVYVSRVRQDMSHPNGLAMWVVADNVRKGAALNSVQIAEILVKDFL
ncbi:MAG: aspartate-semialdehyde dehydrogenase [Gammaproteobacteria bacterium]|nr:aspartate-semialdehyde dehydrogenase [Gammaproteobacteria bacterium]